MYHIKSPYVRIWLVLSPMNLLVQERTNVENGERTRTRGILQQPFDFLDVQRCNRCPEALVEAPWMSETGGRTYKMFEATSSMAHGYKHDGSKQ